MPEKTLPNGTFDPTHMWQQWQDATTKLWTTVLEGNKATSLDPAGLYRAWFKSVSDAQTQVQAMTHLLDPKEAWKLWFETSRDAWKHVAELGADPLGLTTKWLEMLEETRSKMLAGTATPADAFGFFKQWYDATSETWAKEVGELFASDQFMQAISRFLESYTGFTKTIRRANEEYFHSLQLPTRSDIARVAELVIAVEEKVDHVEDAFADFKDAAAQNSSAEALGAIEKRLDQLEGSVKRLHALDSLTGRIEQLERKLDSVLAAIEQSEGKESAGETPRKPAAKGGASAAPGATTKK